MLLLILFLLLVQAASAVTSPRIRTLSGFVAGGCSGLSGPQSQAQSYMARPFNKFANLVLFFPAIINPCMPIAAFHAGPVTELHAAPYTKIYDCFNFGSAALTLQDAFSCFMTCQLTILAVLLDAGAIEIRRIIKVKRP